MAKEEKEKEEKKEVKKDTSKEVCPVCLGRGWDAGSSIEDLCAHCGGSGKYKEIE